MAEKEQQNAHEVTILKIRETAADVKRGQILAFVVTIGAFAVAAFLGFLGHPTAAAVVGGTTIVGLVSAFIKGRQSGRHI